MKVEIKERIEKINKGQVPKGYKRTNVGIIPENWEVKRLGETRDKQDRYSFTGGPFGSDLKREHYTEDGVRILQLQNIGDGIFMNNYKLYTSNNKADELYSCNIFPGEILIAKMAEPLARACILPDNEDRYLMASDGIRLKVDSNKYVAEYIMEAVNSSRFRNEAIKKSTGTTRFRIGLGELSKIKLAIPTKLEQEKIAQILSTWDKAIELKEKLIEEKKDQKKGLMERLLTGQVRSAGFDGEWEEVRLGDISKISSGGTPRSTIAEYYDGEIPWISIADMTTKGKYINSTARNISELGLNNSAAKLYPKGTVLYAMYASIGECSISEVELTSSQAILGIIPCNMLYNEFLYYHLVSIKERMKKQGQQGTQSNLNAGMVKNLYILLPPLQEQKAIAQILSTADKEIDLLSQELDQLKVQKKGLMQLLLTGIIRVQH